MGISAGDADSSTSLQGGTDGTKIGNLGDNLKVVTQPISAVTQVPSWSKKLRYVDMNVASGGVARDTAITTTYTTIFNYSGSGYVAGFLVNVETFTTWTFKFTLDSEVIFEMTAEEITTDKLYDLDDVGDFGQAYIGLSKGSHDRLVFHGPGGSPIYYESSVKVEIKRTSGATKKFQSGLMVLSKET
jgi:hypothetical protein